MSAPSQRPPDLYLDHNATSPMRPAARQVLLELLAVPQPLNPGSVHRHGQLARGRLEDARRRLLRHLVAPDAVEWVFTSGATESNHRVLAECKGPVVSSRLEHPSIRAALESLLDEGHLDCRWVPHDSEGRHALDRLPELLDGAKLAVVSAANNELGTLTELDRWSRACLHAKVPLHVDASQTFGRTPTHWCEGVTSMTLSAHKAGGPVGIGGLALLRGTPLGGSLPGGHQERGRRPGTENVAFAAAWAAVLDAGELSAWAATATVRDSFEERLVAGGAIVNAGAGPRLPNTANVSFPGREAEELLMQLDLAGIAASAGSACTAGSIEPSPVLLALGVEEARVSGAIRFSFGPEHAGSDGAAIAERVLAAIAS